MKIIPVFVSLLLLGCGSVPKERIADGVLACDLRENKVCQAEKTRIYRLIEGQVRHLRGLLKPWNGDPSMKLITESRSGEHHIRPNAMFAADLAFLWRFGKYDGAVVGTSRESLLRYELIPVIRYLVRTHKTGDLKTGDRKSWGDAWQSAHWAAALATAAWWSWDGLPDDLRDAVRKVAGHEADRIVKTVPPHQLKLDSKSEENAWNSQILSAAVLLMPGDPRRLGWESALRKWAFSSYLRPADEHSAQIVDGAPVGQQFTGANIFDDFTLENHDIVHPDYMGAWIMNAGNDLDYRLTHRQPCAGFLYNLPEIYAVQKRFLLPDGGYCYPGGQDWAVFRNADWMPCHATAFARFNDAEALSHLRNAISTAEKMQARHPDGAIYAPVENDFPSSQPHLAYWMIQAWLVLHYAEHELRPAPAAAGVNGYDEGKIILNRGGNFIHTLSWGASVMIQAMPLQADRILSPDTRNGIGRITVAGKLLPVRLQSADVHPLSGGFTAKLILLHGECIRAEIDCESRADGTLSIRETLTAVKDCTTDRIATLSFGILNNPNWVHESGRRAISIGDDPFIIKSGAGDSRSGTAGTATVDSLSFTLDAPGRMEYQGASKIERSRWTDLLVLNSIPDKTQWRAGTVISRRQLLISVNP